MTGEMTDLFADRADGVQRLSDTLQAALPGPVRVYAGPADSGPLAHWVAPAEAGAQWARIASANWLATAQHAAGQVGQGLLIDIGSTTTDLIVLRDGRPASRSRSDRDRLASGELAYHGVVRTPLCALAQRLPLQGQPLNVMNEFFASSADVYRLTGELNPAHDLHHTADQAGKDAHATRQRLARMVGCDVREASEADWLAFAHAWRDRQLQALADSLRRALAAEPLAPDAAGLTVVAAGAGAFLVPDLLARLDGAACPRQRLLHYGRDVARLAGGPGAAERADWAQVCAPSVAVAALLARELH